MGQRGPAPTPTEILKLRGSTLVTKRRQRSEAKGTSGTPRCPQWLDADAKAAWRQLVPQLQTMGVLTRIDGNALARYCRLWSRWRKAEAFLDQHGEVYPLKDENGRVKYLQQWPQVAIASKLAHLLTRLEQEFGMTPSARTRIQVEPRTAEKTSEKSRFFNAG
jgi:P27 family predicted phage terminase small subunit